jgi:hypothetical protein
LAWPDQERVLSALPEAVGTTLSKIAAAAVNMPSGKAAGIAESLLETGLIEKAGMATYGNVYRLTAAGAEHWQRSPTVNQADLPPLPFWSDRVRAVLPCLETQGPIRTRDVGLGWGFPRHRSTR